MYEYVHGGDIYSVKESTGRTQVLDFSVNTNPLGLTEEVKQALFNHIDECERYPDPFCRDLVKALAEYEGIAKEYILCGNGASDLIFRLASALKPKKALLCAPTFADYEKALKTVDCQVKHFVLTENNDFLVTRDFLDEIEADIDVIYLCNPNNPTGQLCSLELICDILAKSMLTHTTVMLDECFIDFIDETSRYTAKGLLDSYPNLIILKAFTKIFSLAGIRLGYALTTNRELISQMRICGQDWAVSTLAQAAGIASLKNPDYLQETKQIIAAERSYLRRELTRIGFKVYGSYANYLFFQTNGIADLERRFLAKGIMIRACANYIGLNAYFYRIAVKNHEDNMTLIQALKEVTAP